MKSYIEEQLKVMIEGEKKNHKTAEEFIDILENIFQDSDFNFINNEQRFVIVESELLYSLNTDYSGRELSHYGLWISWDGFIKARNPEHGGIMYLSNLKGVYFWHYINTLLMELPEILRQFENRGNALTEKIKELSKMCENECINISKNA
ncbi:hypothetical protein [Eubacterium limosum]|uniref:hypothetical protein n=1 Tax=Eubacterium limosum TaxID=1736 RepID=UPI00371E88C8